MVDPLDEEFARPTLKRDRMTLLHWYYFPDSHDSWVSIDLPVDPPDSPPPHSLPWRVNKNTAFFFFEVVFIKNLG